MVGPSESRDEVSLERASTEHGIEGRFPDRRLGRCQEGGHSEDAVREEPPLQNVSEDSRGSYPRHWGSPEKASVGMRQRRPLYAMYRRSWAEISFKG
jgi:hypothetical protein